MQNVERYWKVEKCWKGIGNLTSINKSATSVLNTLSQKDESISDPIKIANIFNNVFSTIAVKTKSKIKFSKKNISDFLKTKNSDTFLVIQQLWKRISNISSLTPNKTTGPFRFP